MTAQYIAYSTCAFETRITVGWLTPLRTKILPTSNWRSPSGKSEPQQGRSFLPDATIFFWYITRVHTSEHSALTCGRYIHVPRRSILYAPFLNPAEMTHSKSKLAVKRVLDRQRLVRDRLAAQPAGIGVMSVNVITPEKCTKWFRHTHVYMPRCSGEFESLEQGMCLISHRF